MNARPVNEYDRAVSAWLRGEMGKAGYGPDGFAKVIGIPYQTLHNYLGRERAMSAGDFLAILAFFGQHGATPGRSIAEINRLAAADRSKAER